MADTIPPENVAPLEIKEAVKLFSAMDVFGKDVVSPFHEEDEGYIEEDDDNPPQR